jgi:Complex I intermediate-associated protein 30 (CIA30)
MSSHRTGCLFALSCLLVVAPSAAPALSVPEPTPGFRFDDFEDGDLVSGSGLLWMIIADDVLGGHTESSLERVGPGASRSLGALRLSATIRPGFAAPFAGAWAPLDGEGKLVDLSGYRALRFRARGSGATFLAGFRRGRSASDSANFFESFPTTETWSTVEVALSDLTPAPPAAASLVWSPRDVSWVGFTSGAGTTGEIWLEIDDVELIGSDDAPAREATAPGPGFGRMTVAETAPEASRLDWKTLAEETVADGRFASLPDAKRLSYALEGGRLWLRIEVAEPPPARWFGVNVALDIDGDPRNGQAWWGFNKEFHFDRLLSAYLTRCGAGSEYQGVVGITDAQGAQAFDFTRLGSKSVSVAVDREGRSFILSVPLEDVGAEGSFHLIATVGSPFIPNDDIPDRGFATIEPGK